MLIKSMKRHLAVFLLHPYFLFTLNLLMLVLYYSSIRITWFELNPSNHFEEAVELWEGYGTILLGIGVILEEHSSLAHILGIRAGELEEDAVEKACHDYGVIFVVFGVIVEMFAWLVKIPNVLLDAYAVEFTFIQISAIAATICAILQIKFSYDIIAAHRKNRKKQK
jgi:hypothetical protein